MGSHSSKDTTDTKLLKKNTRDIRLLVADESNNVHTVVVPKALLAEHSLLFREMVESGALKKLKKIKLEEVTVTGVLKTLQYVENGTVTFESVSEIAETLKVAEKYKIGGIEEICVRHLNDKLDASNACESYEFAVEKDFHESIYKCLKIIDAEAEQVLKSEYFSQLKQDSVIEILKRNTLKLNSELTAFEATLKWGNNEVKRRGQTQHTYDLKKIMSPVLMNVHFKNMTQEEMADPTVKEYLATLSGYQSKDSKFGITSKLSQNDLIQDLSLNDQPRIHLDSYSHHLEVFDSNQSSISNGESFHLKAEVLKGKVFICGMTLAFKTFSNRMTATCLYVALTGTNVRTQDQRKVRGTFLGTSDKSFLHFTNPLFLQDNDIAEISLHVKMAGNVCPLTRRNAVEIVVPANKDIAIKILSDDSSNNNLRCIFKEVIYFY